jgi:copper chaperone NosL
MRRGAWIVVVSLFAPVGLAGCGEDATAGPPEILIGEHVCDSCNMIISDARFAGATIVLDERGRPTPRRFDDLNCQVRYEIDHPDQTVVGRWVHDFTSSQWLPAEGAVYFRADALRTPMGSHTAAHMDESSAEVHEQSMDGELLQFEGVWSEVLGQEPAGQP